MSGHSKWANIRFRKAAQDAKRGKIFTKLIREITTAARMGGGDESSNPRLRSAVVAALAQNMTRDTIKRAIDRGVGGGEGADLENITYEGYGVGGVAVMVECMTDNHNRTASDVRHAFTKFGGNLGTSGSVGYLFTRKGVISFAPDEDGKMMVKDINGVVDCDLDMLDAPATGDEDFDGARYAYTPALGGIMYTKKMSPMPDCVLALNQAKVNGWFQIQSV